MIPFLAIAAASMAIAPLMRGSPAALLAGGAPIGLAYQRRRKD